MFAAGLKIHPHFHSETDEITKQNKLNMEPPHDMRRQVIGPARPRIITQPTDPRKKLLDMKNPFSRIRWDDPKNLKIG
jgi:hypothetical protein